MYKKLYIWIFLDKKLKFQAGFQPWMTIELKLVSVSQLEEDMQQGRPRQDGKQARGLSLPVCSLDVLHETLSFL